MATANPLIGWAMMPMTHFISLYYPSNETLVVAPSLGATMKKIKS